MHHCPHCRSEYNSGVDRCPDCGNLLREGPPPEERRPEILPGTEVVQLCHVADPIEAEIMQAVLAEAGIASHLQTFGVLTAYRVRIADGPTPDYAVVLVTKNCLEEARRVLDEARKSPVEWPEGMEPEE